MLAVCWFYPYYIGIIPTNTLGFQFLCWYIPTQDNTQTQHVTTAFLFLCWYRMLPTHRISCVGIIPTQDNADTSLLRCSLYMLFIFICICFFPNIFAHTTNIFYHVNFIIICKVFPCNKITNIKIITYQTS